MNVLCVCVCVCARVSGWGGRRGYGGRRRRAGKTSWEARKKARREEDEATEEPKHAPAPFITARDKHVRVHFPTNLLPSHKCFVRKTQFLNQQKKYGGRVYESSRTSQPQEISCGCSKKSLGRFVPPARREEAEGGGGPSCLRSRVQYGSGPSSSSEGGGAGLPPELEGDETLRNIEPRMVQLITNEVCTVTSGKYLRETHFNEFCGLWSLPKNAKCCGQGRLYVVRNI